MLVVVLLVACGLQVEGDVVNAVNTLVSPGEDGVNARPSVTPQPSPTVVSSLVPVDESELSDVELRFWYPEFSPGDTIFRQLVNEFNRINSWNISVEPSPFRDIDQLYETLNNELTEGDLPELVLALPYMLENLAQNSGLSADLSQFIRDPVWGFSTDEFAGFSPAFLPKGTGAEIKRLPLLRSGRLIFYNQTWARELGFSAPPNSPAEFRQQACAAAQANLSDENPVNDGTGGWIISTHYTTMLGWMHSFGAEITASDGSGYNFDTPAVQSALRFIRELYEANCAWLPANEISDSDFAQRRGLFTAGTVAAIPDQEAVFADLGSQDQWVVLPFPGPSGRSVVEAYGPDLAIYSKEISVQLAGWLFARWLLEPSQQARLADASAFFPVRSDAVEKMGRLPDTYLQWKDALHYLDGASREPELASWHVVRWSISDAATQLFRSYFTLDQLPETIKLLDATANELNSGKR